MARRGNGDAARSEAMATRRPTRRLCRDMRGAGDAARGEAMGTRREVRRGDGTGVRLGDSDAARGDDDAARDEVMVTRREARRP